MKLFAVLALLGGLLAVNAWGIRGRIPGFASSSRWVAVASWATLVVAAVGSAAIGFPPASSASTAPATSQAVPTNASSQPSPTSPQPAATGNPTVATATQSTATQTPTLAPPTEEPPTAEPPTPVPPTAVPATQPPATARLAAATAPPPSSGGFDVSPYIGKGNVANCPDFRSQANAQAVLRADPSDPNGLDTDKDGIACETRPAPKDLVKVPR